MPKFSHIVIAALLIMAASIASAGEREDARARNAMRVLHDIQSIPESAIPDKLLAEAHAIVIVPDTIKIGFGVGGRGGRGVLAVKNADGRWSHPSFIRLVGGSFGFQIGVQSADVVMVFRNARSLESIVNGKLTLGADAGVAAGPVGRSAEAATDGQLQAEIWSWSRARGLFAGIALDGAVLKIDHKANQAVYGRGSNARMIFEGRPVQPPSSTVAYFRERLEEASTVARMLRGRSPAPAAPAPTPPDATRPASTNAAPPAVFEPVEDPPVRTEPLSGTPG